MSGLNAELQIFLAQHKQIIEDYLVRLLPTSPANRLFSAMHYSLMNNGKRLRPALIYATGRIFDLSVEKLNAPAAAVELIHSYSLIHDDLPAMDDDDLRRGVPTCHKAFDEATAILAGDALQTMAFEVLSDAELNLVSAQQQVAMILVLTKAAGACGMILGQEQDMAAEQKVLSLDNLIKLHQLKTGALFNACIELALIAAGQDSNPEIRESLLDYSANLGLAFQIQDDILDVIGSTTVLGKSAGSDLEAGKATFPSLLGLEGAKQYASATTEQALKAIKPLGAKGKILAELAIQITSRDS